MIPRRAITRLTGVQIRSVVCRRWATDAALNQPSVTESEALDPKIATIVDSIAKLSLFETASLVKELKVSN